ncbi:hypothetical protein R1flu_006110 [Riccia fluitans]|uniref:Secreted protein n=1 Tax=Riccia fluitans TaxID=41844 RepID=A0ABD1YV40_9MARC
MSMNVILTCRSVSALCGYVLPDSWIVLCLANNIAWAASNVKGSYKRDTVMAMVTIRRRGNQQGADLTFIVQKMLRITTSAEYHTYITTCTENSVHIVMLGICSVNAVRCVSMRSIA